MNKIKNALLYAQSFYRPQLTAVQLLGIWSVAIVLFYNGPFWQRSLGFLAPSTYSQWISIGAFGLAIAALQLLIFIPFTGARTMRPVLIILTLVTASVRYFSVEMGTYFDVHMMTNLLETDAHESGQLINSGLILSLTLWGVLPATLIWRCKIVHSQNKLQSRWSAAIIALLIFIAALLSSFQSFSPLLRNHKELRYLITPGNVLVALPRALAGQAEKLTIKRSPIGTDAQQRPTLAGEKPLLLVVVIGETQRAANWQLNGYERETTPNLAARDDLISFRDVSSCGTSTAVSLPCMFSRYTRKTYQPSSARGEQTLVDVINTAGVGVEWIDNQSGCKGVCSEVESDRIAKTRFPQLCADGECLDEVLVHDLKEELAEETHRGNQLLVLHMMGSHGPSYYRRYPAENVRFMPDCRQDELSQCSQQEVVNAYDNTIAYSDRVLNALIETLSRHRAHHTALIYLSDHGESLGEMGLYLHGLPYFIAPEEQTKVPMFWWLSSGYLAAQKLDSECLDNAAMYPTSHDALLHSVLGLLNIETELYEPELDPAAECRSITD